MKKMVVCLLLSCMVAFTFVGCSNNSSGKEEGDTNISTENESTEESEKPNSTEESENVENTENEGTENESTESINLEEMTLEELYQKAMDSYASKNIEPPFLFPETDVEYLENFYPGISYANIKQIYVAMAPVTNAPMEIALVEVADSSDVAAIRDIFTERIEERSKDTTYPEESATWKKNAKVTIRGNYIFMVVMTDDYGIPEEFILD